MNVVILNPLNDEELIRMNIIIIDRRIVVDQQVKVVDREKHLSF